MSQTDRSLSPDLSRELFALAIRATHLKALAAQAEADVQRLMAQVRLVRGISADADLSLEFLVAGTLAVKGESEGEEHEESDQGAA